MAGRTGDLAQVAHAAVDGGHDTQRHVQFVEHRALFYVHFYKAEVVVRVALDAFNIGHVQAGMRHGLAHSDAVSVLLVKPGGLEVTDQCAGA